MDKESKGDITTTVQTMEQVKLLSTILRRKIIRYINLPLKHMGSRSGIDTLKTFKEEAETALKECIKVSENLVYTYITDPQEQEHEEEDQVNYQEHMLSVVETIKKHIKARRHGEYSEEEEEGHE